MKLYRDSQRGIFYLDRDDRRTGMTHRKMSGQMLTVSFRFTEHVKLGSGAPSSSKSTWESEHDWANYSAHDFMHRHSMIKHVLFACQLPSVDSIKSVDDLMYR